MEKFNGKIQWKNSHSVIKWFEKIDDKPNHMFLTFDIVEFYPSISKELLERVIEWAKTLTPISDDDITIIQHARKSLLFAGVTPWVKRNTDSTFDVTMGSFDGAEICELVGLFILSKLELELEHDNVGLYRDDGLALIPGTNGRDADTTRKKLIEIFHHIGLKITAEVNYQIVNFLDITLNLNNGKFKPYRKPNNNPQYVDSRSNYPPSIIKQVPKSINQRISSLSSDKQSFDTCKPIYENALKKNNYNMSLNYSNFNHATTNTTQTSSPTNRKRRRAIIWFNPPFSKSVKMNVGREFLRLIDKHFPTTNPLHKLFNRNTIKVSYSCMPNVKNIISRHNKKVLSQATAIHPPVKCNCRNPAECPLNQKCLSNNVVYAAEVKSKNGNEVKRYIGMTANPFKSRFSNHKKSFNHIKYEKETELSKYVWDLKRNQKDFTISWSIMKSAPAYISGCKRCNLCIEEKLCLMQGDAKNQLSKRSEIFAKCRHQEKFWPSRFKRTRKLSVG